MTVEGHSNREGKAQMSSIIKWKWFAQEHAVRGLQRLVQCIRGEVHSFSLGLTLESHEELLIPLPLGTGPYKQLLTDQKRAA